MSLMLGFASHALAECSECCDNKGRWTVAEDRNVSIRASELRKSLQNFATEMEQTKSTEYPLGTDPQGVRLVQVTEGTLPSLLGLKSGDVVLCLDGINLQQKGQITKLWGRLQRDGHLAVKIEREGKIIAMSCSVKSETQSTP